jgi:hypothetical protein
MNFCISAAAGCGPAPAGQLFRRKAVSRLSGINAALTTVERRQVMESSKAADSVRLRFSRHFYYAAGGEIA